MSEGASPYAALNPQWQAQPMNLEAEAALLGALLSNNRAIERCGNLKAAHFAGENHGAVFQAIVDGIAAGHVVDAVTLKWEFESAFLASLLRSLVGIINITDYARVIRDAADARELIAIGEAMVDAARIGSSVRDIGMMAARQLELLTMGDMASHQYTLNEAIENALAKIDRASKGETAGVSSGFKGIDARLGGLEPGMVYVLAGRPGMGKSSLGHQVALNVARGGVGVLELSLEMSADQLGVRTLSSATGIPLNRLKRGDLVENDANRLILAQKDLLNLPLTIDDMAGQTPAQIAIKARAAKRKHGLGLVMIDHLNLMAPDEQDSRHGGTWATERASATVLQIAKDCACPVLLLAQLNRGVEGREDKRPVLSDLRQSGAIEQDAYAVGFVYRPEYYDRNPPKVNDGESYGTHTERLRAWEEQRQALAGKAELIWGKVRDGETGTDMLRFNGATTTFSEEWS